MSKTTILIVEDEVIVAADLAGKLARLGYDVAGTAAEGEEAVALACRLRPQLVLMDIWLEGPMDGIAAAEAIRRQHDVPIVYLTAHSDPATLARAKLTGPFGYILKPFEERDLATQIEMALYRHQADRELRQQREWLRVTLSSIGDAVIATDAAAQVTFFNPVAEALTGWKADEAAGRPVQCVFRIVNEQTGAPLEEPVARVLRDCRAIELANHAALVTKDGRTVPIEDSAAPILDAAGKLVGVVLVFHDVTEKRRAEEALRASETRYRDLVQYANSAIVRWKRDGTVAFFNEYAQEFFGYSAEEIIGKHVSLLLPQRESSGADLSGLAQAIVAHPDRYVNYVNENVCRDGRRVWMAWTNRAILDEHGQVNEVLAVGSDITERRRAEAERARLAAIVESSDDAILSKNLDGIIQSWNLGAERIYGYRADEIIGQPISLLMSPERFDEEEQIVQRLRRGERVVHLETIRVTKDGRRVDVSVTVSPLKDDEGRVVGASTISRDITARKQAEAELAAAKASAERAKEAAEHANRAKDHFLAVLSHELRTPLTPVVMGTSMLQRRPDLDPEVRETLEMVRRNIEMEARLIDDLLDVTRIARGKIELTRSAVELGTVIQRAVEVCKPDIEARKLHFGVDMGPASPYWVDADVSRLQQVFWNLLKNAIKFTPHGGCVGIRARKDEGGRRKDEGDSSSFIPHASSLIPDPSSFVLVEVNDSGIGIEPEALSRIFNAFEQAELSITRQFGGLGLGLAISKALVEMHGGQIDAQSAGRDKGSTFRVRLPLTKPVVQPELSPPTARPRRIVPPLRVLLVEDHGVTAKMMKTVLTTEGHTVEMAGDVATAVQLAGQQAFDLLLSDLGLPDGSGHDLMRQLRERGHKFPGIALSGYGQEEDIRRSHEAGFIAHLTKPASREAVVEAVAAVTASDG